MRWWNYIRRLAGDGDKKQIRLSENKATRGGSQEAKYVLTSLVRCPNCNRRMASVKYKGKTYYIDPTEKYISFGQYAERIQGREAANHPGPALRQHQLRMRNNEQRGTHHRESQSMPER